MSARSGAPCRRSLHVVVHLVVSESHGRALLVMFGETARLVCARNRPATMCYPSEVHGLSITRRPCGVWSASTWRFPVVFTPERDTSRAHTRLERYNFGTSSPTRRPCAILGYLRPCHSPGTSPLTPRRAPRCAPHRRSPAMAKGGAPPLSQPTSRPCEGLAPGDHSRTQLTTARLQ
jgi:hypothetical protein